MACYTGLDRAIYKILNNKPWFKYRTEDRVIEILDSPNKRINKNTSVGVARNLANAINALVNKGDKRVGEIAYPAFSLDGRGIVRLNAQPEQLDLINAVEKKEIEELQRKIERERLQKEFEYLSRQSNTYVNEEGDIVSIDDLPPNLRPIRDEDDILYQKEIKPVSTFRSKQALKDLSLRLASRIGIGLVFQDNVNLPYRGYVTKDKVIINLAKVTDDTPFHEILAHPIIRAIKRRNKDLYESLINEIKNSTEGQKVLDEIAENYPELDKEGQEEEAVVTLLGRMASEKLSEIENATLLSKLKELWLKISDFVRELLSKDKIEIESLPITTTLKDLAEIMGYGNNKIVLPGYSLFYKTPLGNLYDNRQEALDEIRGFTSLKFEDFDDFDVVDSVEKIPVDYIQITFSQEQRYFFKKDGKWYIKEGKNESEANENDVLALYNKKVEMFIDFVKSYSASKSAVLKWIEKNNIVYDPEEAYTRGYGFYSLINLITVVDTELVLQNILSHIEDSEKIGGEFIVSASTYIPSKIESGDNVRLVIYPSPEDIKWAAKSDVFSSSMVDFKHVGIFKTPIESLGLSFDKYPDPTRINFLVPSIQDSIEEVSSYNEIAIRLRPNNFRIEYSGYISDDIKRLADKINRYLDNKYGKIEKPKIKDNGDFYYVDSDKKVYAGGKVSNIKVTEPLIYKSDDYTLERIDYLKKWKAIKEAERRYPSFLLLPKLVKVLDYELFESDEFLYSKNSKDEVYIESTENKVKELLEKMGVSIQGLSEYAKEAGLDVSGVKGVADLAKKVIAVAEGIDTEILTEEAVHIATAIIEQVNPNLITEMISKIDRFKIYKETLEKYKNLKAYQLPNGKPNIRKIKKEAVDKLIAALIVYDGQNIEAFPELQEDKNISFVKALWNAILDWFRGQYRKSNIEIFQRVTSDILSGRIGKADVIKSNEVYYHAVDDLYNTIKDYDGRMELIPEGDGEKRHYTLDGKKINLTVTEIVKKNRKDLNLTEKQIADAEVKRELGTEAHEFLANYIKTNLIDKDGYALETPNDYYVNHKFSEGIANALKDFAKNLVASYKKGTRFLVEVKVVNQKIRGGIASTIDFMAIEPDGESYKVDIYDWKFISIDKKKYSDIQYYNVKEWNMQMGFYVDMIKNYGAKSSQIRKARMVPFQFNYTREVFGNLLLKSIEIGNLDPTKESKMYLLPVPVEIESTGHSSIDKLVSTLTAYYKKVYSTFISPEEKHIKDAKLNSLFEAIRSLRVKMDFEPLVLVATQFLNDAKKAFDKFKDIDYNNISTEELNSILSELLVMKEQALRFKDLDQIFVSYIGEEGRTDPKNKQLLSKLEDVSTSSKRMLDSLTMLFSAFTVQLANKSGLKIDLTQEGKVAPEKEIKGIISSFTEPSNLPDKIINLAVRLLTEAKNISSIETIKLSKQFSKLLYELEEQAKKENKRPFDLIATFVNDKPRLISKFDINFVSKVKSARKDKDKNFFLNTVDLQVYNKKAKELLEKKIDYAKKKVYSLDPIENEIKMSAAIKRIKNSLELESANFNGFDDYDFKRLFWESLKNEEQYYSKEYKNMSEPAKNMWMFFSNLNRIAAKMGYLDKDKSWNFFPLMEATIMQKFKNFGGDVGGSVRSILHDMVSIREEEKYEYSRIDPLTGELKREVPRLFTHSSKSAKELSTDLNKVGIMWINALMEYQSLKEIENTLLVLEHVERNRGSIITDSAGNVVFEHGVPKTREDNEYNANLLRSIIDDGLYGLKENLSSISNIVIGNVSKRVSEKLTGTEIEAEKQISGRKVYNNLNRLYQMLAVGLKATVAIPNHFGAHFQAIINSGRLITAKEFEKNYVRLLTKSRFTKNISEEELALLDYLIPLNEDVTKEVRRKVASKQSFLDYLNTWSFSDVMMATNYFPDRAIQYASALSFLQNAIVIDGNVLNARQYLRRMDLQNKYKMSEQRRKELESTFEDRLKKLKEEYGLLKLVKIGEDGNISVEGVSDKELAKMRNLIIEYNRKLTSQVSYVNKAAYERDILMKSFMMFKRWIPKQVSIRMRDIGKNLETDEWEYGRFRAFMSVILHVGFNKINRLMDIISGNDRGIALLKELYEEKKRRYYEQKGVELEITEEEFYDLIRNEIQNQFKELVILLGVISMVLAVMLSEPDEDEDDIEKSKWKYFMKLANKISDEIWFYYNPISFQSLTRGSIFPAADLLVQLSKFFNHLLKMLYGEVVGDEEIIEKSYPRKYLFNLIPVVSQVQRDIMPYIDPEWAKEHGIRVSPEARVLR